MPLVNYVEWAIQEQRDDRLDEALAGCTSADEYRLMFRAAARLSCMGPDGAAPEAPSNGLPRYGPIWATFAIPVAVAPPPESGYRQVDPQAFDGESLVKLLQQHGLGRPGSLELLPSFYALNTEIQHSWSEWRNFTRWQKDGPYDALLPRSLRPSAFKAFTQLRPQLRFIMGVVGGDTFRQLGLSGAGHVEHYALYGALSSAVKRMLDPAGILHVEVRAPDFAVMALAQGEKLFNSLSLTAFVLKAKAKGATEVHTLARDPGVLAFEAGGESLLWRRHRMGSTDAQLHAIDALLNHQGLAWRRG